MKSIQTAPSGTIIACSVLLLSLSSQAAPAFDTNRFFIGLHDAETVAARVQLCEQLSFKDAPQYIVSFCQSLESAVAGSDSLASLLIEESLALQPDFILGPLALADTYAERSKWKLALRWYGRARGIAPDRLDPYYGIGRVWLDRAATEGAPAYEEALKAFREMTRVDPAGADGWSNIGMVLATLGRYDEAEESYQKALALTPNDPELFYSIGSLESRRGDDQKAEEAWKRSLAIDPAHAAAAEELASLYGRQGRFSEAVTVLEDGVNAAHVGDAAGRLRRNLALIYLLQEQPARSVALLEEARVMNPDARTLAALAHIYLLRSETDDGLSLLAVAAKKDSAAVRPFARAWETKIATGLRSLSARDAAGAAILKALTARPVAPGESAGPFASRTLAQALLPDWKIPDGPIAPQRESATAEYDTPPTPTYRAKATYPEAAGEAEAIVQVRVRIDTRGSVTEAKVIGEGGNPALDWAAVEAAKRWRFQPAMRNGLPVESEVTIPFKFSP